ncbi:olfactory receptor 11A1-like [Gopherus evgoodei]|uniref:olfactory receptor 11A1-like n=1 Tax=Gopherus evgoodei TaxID=1825980 RepID=UPI0011CF977D|nr:olfactory receptor 11A1-like [Gopherus evgoodei]XP_030403612.1 olfactory receptor 11A1-like [Gopherus evgoodei]
MHLEDKAEEDNQTIITEYILLGFGNLPELQILLFLVFLVIYIVTMSGNILIVALVVADQHLHTPMYFFLGNLSCLETCYTLTILPRLLASLLTGDRTISVSGCFAQFYCFGCLITTECYLLAVMSYDRYLAICKPLHYATLMNSRLCLQLATESWISEFLTCVITMWFMLQLTFCGPNEIDHFFSCSDTSMITLVSFILASINTPCPFLLTVTSYVCIIATILRIPSTTGRQKAFSTCSSHLIVVTVFYGTLMTVYLLPKTKTLKALNKVFSVFYTVLTPMLNPLIYNLRNKEVKEALRKVIS